MSKININIPTVDEYTVVITMPRGAIVNIKYEVLPETSKKAVASSSSEGVFVELPERKPVENKTISERKPVEKKTIPERKPVEEQIDFDEEIVLKSPVILPAKLPLSYVQSKPQGRPVETKRHYFNAGGDLFRMKKSKVDKISSGGIITSASNWYNENIGNWYLVYVTEFETGSSTVILNYDSDGNIMHVEDSLEYIRTYYEEVQVTSVNSSLQYMGPGCVHVGNYYCKF